MRTFISFEEARAAVLAAGYVLGKESVRLDASLDRTLAQPIQSLEEIPPFDNSAMDGFAVRCQDCLDASVQLRVVADIPAGSVFESVVGSGECARIMTGAPVPGGADAIVPVEKTRADGEYVWIDDAPTEGAHIRRAGQDVSRGETVFQSGSVITPPVMGMLATLGYDPVLVAEQPRVAVISTGDEIVPPSETPGPGQIRNSNGPALAAQVVSAGGFVHTALHAGDTPEAIRNAVQEANGAHIFLFSGGVSMGELDFVRTELDHMGAVWEFWKVKQRPGKPLAFGLLGKTLLLGLPGNPVSSAMCFEAYVRPLIAKMLDRANPFRELRRAVLSAPVKKVKGLYYFTRGMVDADAPDSTIRVRETGPQGSNLYSSVVRADCIIHLDEQMENPGEGTEVKIEMLHW